MTEDRRLDAIFEMMLALARRDFTHRVAVEGTDTIDAIATGLNMLAEELDGEIASRQELEAAYAALQAAQAKLVHAEKMAAIGLLASGVAHEVNNPAAWVTLSLGILRRSVAALQRAAERGELDRAAAAAELATMERALADATDGVGRISTVVRDLRTLSGVDDRTFEEIPFREVITGACRLASSVIARAKVAIDVDESAVVVANRGRVAQVVTNLLVNAAQAVRDLDEPAIEVSTTAHEGGVVLAVEDNGGGIPEALRRRLFDPFFTTKPPEEGTGLGLTIVAQIAAESGGWARATAPRRASGARVEVFLPDRPSPQSLRSSR